MSRTSARLAASAAKREKQDSTDDEDEPPSSPPTLNTSIGASQQECSVCLSQMELPIRLPCSHHFCYTCAKGLAQTNRACAMCRGQIPPDFLLDPDKYVVGIIREPNLEYAWFYEGNQGWWMYEPRVQGEVEIAFQNGDPSTEALIAGHLYVIDFKNELQYRKDLPGKRRKIKRDLASIAHKGLAGLKQDRRPEFPPGKE